MSAGTHASGTAVSTPQSLGGRGWGAGRKRGEAFLREEEGSRGGAASDPPACCCQVSPLQTGAQAGPRALQRHAQRTGPGSAWGGLARGATPTWAPPTPECCGTSPQGLRVCARPCRCPTRDAVGLPRPSLPARGQGACWPSLRSAGPGASPKPVPHLPQGCDQSLSQGSCGTEAGQHGRPRGAGTQEGSGRPWGRTSHILCAPSQGWGGTPGPRPPGPHWAPTHAATSPATAREPSWRGSPEDSREEGGCLRTEPPAGPALRLRRGHRSLLPRARQWAGPRRRREARRALPPTPGQSLLPGPQGSRAARRR